jgi:Zn-dependent protease
MDEKPKYPLSPLPPLSANTLSEEEEIRRRRLGEEAARKLGKRFTRRALSANQGHLLRRVVITLGTLLLALVAAGFYYGWFFGTGVITLIFLHELGHVWAARQCDLPVGDLVFIPFLGAFVTLQRHDDPTDAAFVSLMGPVFGTVAGLICVVLGYTLSNEFFLNLAEFDLGITLFNLIPIRPLDGGGIAPLFILKTWQRKTERTRLKASYVGLILFLLVAMYFLPSHPFFPISHS